MGKRRTVFFGSLYSCVAICRCVFISMLFVINITCIYDSKVIEKCHQTHFSTQLLYNVYRGAIAMEVINGIMIFSLILPNKYFLKLHIVTGVFKKVNFWMWLLLYILYIYGTERTTPVDFKGQDIHFWYAMAIMETAFAVLTASLSLLVKNKTMTKWMHRYSGCGYQGLNKDDSKNYCSDKRFKWFKALYYLTIVMYFGRQLTLFIYSTALIVDSTKRAFMDLIPSNPLTMTSSLQLPGPENQTTQVPSQGNSTTTSEPFVNNGIQKFESLFHIFLVALHGNMAYTFFNKIFEGLKIKQIIDEETPQPSFSDNSTQFDGFANKASSTASTAADDIPKQGSISKHTTKPV